MNTCEDLNDSSSNEDNKEEVNLCLMHEDLKKAHQVHLVNFVLETTSPGNVQDASICEEVKALLDKKVSSGCKTLLKDFQDLEERLKEHELLKELPLETVKLYEEIETLRNKLEKFVSGHEALKKIIKVQRNPNDKSGHGFKGKKIIHGEEAQEFMYEILESPQPQPTSSSKELERVEMKELERVQFIVEHATELMSLYAAERQAQMEAFTVPEDMDPNNLPYIGSAP
ncbi:hypothetical protein JHK82_055652 [Glycine max]|nr:hypothetical protein JHK82_055652 [Glycine max]